MSSIFVPGSNSYHKYNSAYSHCRYPVGSNNAKRPTMDKPRERPIDPNVLKDRQTPVMV